MHMNTHPIKFLNKEQGHEIPESGADPQWTTNIYEEIKGKTSFIVFPVLDLLASFAVVDSIYLMSAE